MIKKQEAFILACGGHLEEKEIIEEKFEKKEKVKTIMITKEYIDQKLNLKEIAEKRGFTIQTIIAHIEELFEAREINIKNIEYIIKDIEKKYNKDEIKIIQKIYSEDIGLKAKKEKIENDFKIKIDYNSLKLIGLTV